jgi:hypothetical protein
MSGRAIALARLLIPRFIVPGLLLRRVSPHIRR